MAGVSEEIHSLQSGTTKASREMEPNPFGPSIKNIPSKEQLAQPDSSALKQGASSEQRSADAQPKDSEGAAPVSDSRKVDSRNQPVSTSQPGSPRRAEKDTAHPQVMLLLVGPPGSGECLAKHNSNAFCLWRSIKFHFELWATTI